MRISIAQGMIMPFIKLLTLAAALIAISTSAHAQRVCSQETINLREMGPADSHCNPYNRQLAYREERLKFRKMIEDRREEYYAPQREAQKQYQEDLEALNEERNHDDDIYGR